MRKFFYILFFVLTLFGCNRKICPEINNVVKDSIVYKLKQHDSIVYVPGATVHIHDTITPKANNSFSADSGNVHLSINVDKNGKLTATCKADSLQKLLQWMTTDRDYYKNHVIIETKTVSVAKPYVPWWVWVLVSVIGAGIILKVVSIFYPQLSLFKNI